MDFLEGLIFANYPKLSISGWNRRITEANVQHHAAISQFL